MSTGPTHMAMTKYPHMFPDARNKNMVYGLGSQQFSRYWSTSGLRGMEPFHMVMISIPSNVPFHKEQEYIWFKVRDLDGF
jgi:hypothetical protein